MLAAEYKNEKKYSPIHVIVVYLGGIGKRPQQYYPDKSRRGEGCLHFKLRQIFLGNLPGMAANVRKIRARIADRKSDAGIFRLTPEELIRLYLAPLGRVPLKPWKTVEDYLALGLDLSEMANDLDILRMMFWSVVVRGNIISEKTFN
ncbi:MAG: hypothetical protein LBR80_00100, partial [Deltaproteobacteria bacterium]|nr:hypothetical protein [Deltaproteobacteria bacterium]